MQSKVVKTLALALLLGAAAVVPGQQPTKKIHVEEEEQTAPRAKQKAPLAKSKLEEILAEAIKNNPDIRVASANVILAEAELNRIRLQATQKVITLHHAIQSQQAVVSYEQKQYDRMQGLLRDQAVDSRLVEERFAKLTAAKAKLEELEAQMPALLGRVQRRAMEETDGTPSFRSSLEYDGDGRPDVLVTPGSNAPQSYRWIKAKTYEFEHAKVNFPHAEKLRKALQTPVKVNFVDATLDTIFGELSKMVPELVIRNLTRRGDFVDYHINLRSEEPMPVSAILQAIADETGYTFYVREYGIMVIQNKIAPPGAMTVEEFLHAKPEDEARPKSGVEKNPPRESVEGLVKFVGAGGLITISIGSDAGLAKGQTLDLHWKPHQPPIEDARPFGTVRIVEVEAHQAVVQPVGRLSHHPQVGDRIIGSIQKK